MLLLYLNIADENFIQKMFGMEMEGRAYSRLVGIIIIGVSQITMMFSFVGVVSICSISLIVSFVCHIVYDLEYYNIILDTVMLFVISLFICHETYQQEKLQKIIFFIRDSYEQDRIRRGKVVKSSNYLEKEMAITMSDKFKDFEQIIQ